MIKNLLSKKTVQNSLWLILLQVVNTVIPILTIPYITRILGAEKYGLFSVALNWTLYFQVVVEFGFGLNGARKVAILKNDKKLNEIFNNIISSRIILCIFTFVLLNIIYLVLSFSKETYICMLLLYIMVLGTTFQLTWLFQGKQDMKFITIINSIARIISILLIVILVKDKKDIYIYCFLYSITMFLSSIIGIIIAYKKYNLKFKFSKIRDISLEIKESVYLFFSSAMTKIFSGFGITVLGIFSTNYYAGIYSAIYKVPYIMTMFFSPISQAIYPYCSSKFNTSFEDGIKKIKKICIPIFCAFMAIGIFIITLRTFLIKIVFGKEYSLYSVIVIPLIIQFLFAIINNFIGIQTLVASGKQKNYTRAFTIGCVVNVIFNILLCKLYGISGVAIAAMMSEIVLFICLMMEIKKIKIEIMKGR